MTLKDFIEETSIITNKEDIDLIVNADGMDTDVLFLELDKKNLVLRIFGE